MQHHYTFHSTLSANKHFVQKCQKYHQQCTYIFFSQSRPEFHGKDVCGYINDDGELEVENLSILSTDCSKECRNDIKLKDGNFNISTDGGLQIPKLGERQQVNIVTKCKDVIRCIYFLKLLVGILY